MDTRQKEYLDYYKARMEKYRNNPMYANSFLSEKAFCDALESAASIEEFGDIVNKEKLPLKNMLALIRDKETARLTLNREIKEPIRAKSSEIILGILDAAESDMQLIGDINHIENKVNAEVSLDMMHDAFFIDFPMLENIEVWRNAEIPDEWKKENEEYIKEALQNERKAWREDFLPAAHNIDPNWNFNIDAIWEARHRRVIPFPDEIIKKRLEQFKELKGI